MEFEQMLRLCAQYDNEACREFYMRYRFETFNCCFRILQNSSESEEVMHNVFLKAFKHLDTFVGDEKHLCAYLKKIGINMSINILRERKKINFVAFEEDIPVDLPAEENEDFDYSVEFIKQTINDLPNGYRLIITLRLLEELDFEEIAKQLKIKPSTVRSQYVRALAKLRLMLNQKPKPTL